VCLSDACHVVSGFAFKSEDFCDKGIPVVKIANVGYGEFVWKDQQYLPDTFLTRYAAFEVRPGDLLLALTRPVTEGTLKVCRYPDEAPPALLNQRVALLRTESSGDAKYLLAQMRSPAFRRKVLEAVSQTLQPNLSPLVLKQFGIRWPAEGARNKIAAEVDRHVSIVREVEAEVDSNLKRAQVLRQAVLARAFRT
jgi:type I restriction enzyme S subunit